MLLQQVVALLDVELDRLRTLRSIVSGLSATGLDALEEQTRSAPVLLAETEPSEAPVLAPPKQPKQRKTRRMNVARQAPAKVQSVASAASALRGPIPNAPVVVHRDALQHEHARRQQVRDTARESAPKQEFGSLGAMIRALRPEALG